MEELDLWKTFYTWSTNKEQLTMTAAEKKTIKQDHVTVTKDPLNLN